MRLKPLVAASVLAGVYFAFTVFVISGLPHDLVIEAEAPFNAQAQSVWRANTPLFFHAGGETWLQPVAVYSNAALHAIASPGRVASAIVGAVDVALVFLIAHAIGGTGWAAFAAAITLVFTLGHLGLAMLATDAIFPAAFVLLWLHGVQRFLKWDSPRALYGAAAALGLCIYAHPAGPLTAVFLWMLTLAVAWRRNRIRLAAASLVFALMWTPAAAWFFLHPGTYPDTFGRWFIFAPHLRNPLDGIRAFFNANTLGTRASLYWGFWDPSWLFFSAGDSRAPLLLLAAPFMLFAIVRARFISRDVMTVLIGAVVTVPLAGATFGAPHYMQQASPIMPLLAILSGLGADQLVAVITRRRQPLEDDVPVAGVEGWHDDDALPRS